MSDATQDGLRLLSVQTIQRGSAVVIRLAGHLDGSTRKLVNAELAAQIGRRPPVLVLDLTDTESIDHFGDHLVQHARQCAERDGVQLVIAVDKLRSRRATSATPGDDAHSEHIAD